MAAAQLNKEQYGKTEEKKTLEECEEVLPGDFAAILIRAFI